MKQLRRNDDDLSAFLLFLIIFLVAIIFCFIFPAAQGQASLPRMEPLTATFTADDDVIKAYVLIDPDTKQQYIVTDHGGITPRL